MKDLGKAKHCIGLNIIYDKKMHGISLINQHHLYEYAPNFIASFVITSSHRTIIHILILTRR